jgi:hypothetical protein
MSLIYTHINRYGIIVASDSNLSTNAGNAGFGQKVFPIPHLNAALAYSGAYGINNESIDIWMTNFISGSVFTNQTINEFVTDLTATLTAEMSQNEFGQGNIIHIAGYQKTDNFNHLEHWHIANMGLQQDGDYSIPANNFHNGNDFNSRKVQSNREFLIQLDEDPINHQFYINGFPPGRISALRLKHSIDNTLNQIWNHPEWMFRKPVNLFESASIVKLYYTFIAELFKISDHAALYIGGETQTYLIPAPQNLNKNAWE